jgi:hypothetical protein
MQPMTGDLLRLEARRALRLAETATNEMLRWELLEIAAEFAARGALERARRTQPPRSADVRRD